jgi:hypothetical protein
MRGTIIGAIMSFKSVKPWAVRSEGRSIDIPSFGSLGKAVFKTLFN